MKISLIKTVKLYYRLIFHVFNYFAILITVKSLLIIDFIREYIKARNDCRQMT